MFCYNGMMPISSHTALEEGTLTFTPGLEPTIYCIRGGHANLHTTDDPGLEHTIYCIRGGHANLHTTDAVFKSLSEKISFFLNI
jgi:hypothetical protein